MPATRHARPLSPLELRHLEERLLEERARTLRALNRHARVGTAGDAETDRRNHFADHMADVGSETMEETIDAALAARETRTLGEIDRALRRLYRSPDRFGVDESTGQPIPFARLDLIPWARHVA
jgi:RNA polymerase-binding transcription factor DksA